MYKFPNIKKTVKKFLLNEDGRITKSNLIKLGIVVIGSAGMLLEQAKEASGHCSHHNGSSAHRNKDCEIDLHNNAVGGESQHSSCTGKDEGTCKHGSSHGNWGDHDDHYNAHNNGSPCDCTAHGNTLNPLHANEGTITGRHTHNIQHETADVTATGVVGGRRGVCKICSSDGDNFEEHQSCGVDPLTNLHADCT